MAIKRSIIIGVLGLLAMSSVNAFIASNTVPATLSGSGSGTISGYTVSAVAYTLNTTTPTNLDAVTFTLSAAAVTAKVKLVAAGSTFYACTNVVLVWTCNTTTPQATVAAADQLTVVATN